VKEYLAALIRPTSNPIEARNLAREYLQALILQSLQRAGAMTALAFHGGTALRFLFSLPRFSEDLDFALEGNPTTYDFRANLQSIRKDLEAQGYTITIKANDGKTVHSAFVRFPNLLFELSLSPHRDEILAVKIEVDTNPPARATLATSLVRRHVLLNVQHHDQASLLAGKLHAILQRPYFKGRDLYDMMWYLSDREWPPPNLDLLNNALKQTGWRGEPMLSNNWREEVRKKIKSTPWDQVVDDIRPFIASPVELGLLTKENLLNLLK
jgi:predicted nucleotidyltransferase component of viral defense system